MSVEQVGQGLRATFIGTEHRGPLAPSELELAGSADGGQCLRSNLLDMRNGCRWINSDGVLAS